MRAGRRIAAAIVVAIALAAGLSPAQAPRATNRPWPAEFPAGPGRAIAERACVACHSPMLVAQQAKDSTGWEKSIAQMEKWGATLSPAEHDTLRAWLVATLGPRR